MPRGIFLPVFPASTRLSVISDRSTITFSLLRFTQMARGSDYPQSLSRPSYERYLHKTGEIHSPPDLAPIFLVPD